MQIYCLKIWCDTQPELILQKFHFRDKKTNKKIIDPVYIKNPNIETQVCKLNSYTNG